MIESRLNAILAASNDVGYEWDFASDRIVWYGPAHALFETAESNLPQTGKALQKLIHPDDSAIRMDVLAQHAANGEACENEFRLRRNGLFGWVHERAGLEYGTDGKATMQLGILRVIDERKHREAALRHSALYDSVTGQFNRSRLLDSVNEKLLQTRRYGTAACYIVIGLKSYVPVNESTASGASEDAILVAISQQIEICLRASDVIGRVGKRDFGILITHCNPGDMAVVTQKLLDRFEKRDLHTVEGVYHINLAAGGIMLPGCALTGYDIMENAESALATARGADEPQMVEYEWPEDVCREYIEAVPVGDQVLAALKDDRIEFAFQPLVDATSKQVVFYEALLRLWDESRNLIPAKDFIPAIEKLGYSRIIDRRTLDLTMFELTRSPDVRMALNISGVTVSDSGWMRRLTSHLRGRPDIASRLIIEITETVAMKEMAHSIRFVNQVRELGCKVALDDFGAGYITFRHLKTLTVDIVKIDGALIRNIVDNRDNQALVRTLIELAHAFRLEIVAEFVETAEEAEYLQQAGVHFLQGYYFGKPSFDRPWLEEHRQPAMAG